jgi:hypothetical protein
MRRALILGPFRPDTPAGGRPTGAPARRSPYVIPARADYPCASTGSPDAAAVATARLRALSSAVHTTDPPM